jgi:hypothetical protein
MESLGLSSLALSLFGLAVAILVAVVAHNAWSGRRRRGGEGADASRVSPTGPGGMATPAGDPQRAEPRFDQTSVDESVSSEAAAMPAGGSDAPPSVRLDPLTDCIIEFELDAPVAAERLLPMLQGLRRAGDKPVIVEACPARPEGPGATPMSAGMPADPSVELRDTDTEAASAADGTGPVAPTDWMPLAAGRRVSRVRIGVLLANRHGALNAMAYSEFVAGVQLVAEQLAVLGDTPDMNAVLQRARALDERLGALDALVGINVQTPQPLSLAELAGVARECGCVERGNNRFARLAPGGEVLYSLSLSDIPERLSLLLDVPRAPAAADPWASLLACARHCAMRLDGALVDDQGRELGEGALARIGEQVAARQSALAQAGFEPGSPLALRAFN